MPDCWIVYVYTGHLYPSLQGPLIKSSCSGSSARKKPAVRQARSYRRFGPGSVLFHASDRFMCTTVLGLAREMECIRSVQRCEIDLKWHEVCYCMHWHGSIQTKKREEKHETSEMNCRIGFLTKNAAICLL